MHHFSFLDCLSWLPQNSHAYPQTGATVASSSLHVMNGSLMFIHAHLLFNACNALFATWYLSFGADATPRCASMDRPKYLKLQTLCNTLPVYVKSPLSVYAGSNTTTLVLAVFTVRFLWVQKSCRASSWFCNPVADIDRTNKSSANMRSGTSLPVPRPGMSALSPLCNMTLSSSSMNSPNRLGLNGQPCLTPKCNTQENMPIRDMTESRKLPLHICICCKVINVIWSEKKRGVDSNIS